MARTERRTSRNFDFREMTPRQKANFMAGFETYVASKYNKKNAEATVSRAKEYLGMDGAKIDPMENYITVVDLMKKYAVAEARRRAEASKGIAEFKQSLQKATPEIVWNRLTANAHGKVVIAASEDFTAEQRAEYQRNQAEWQKICEQKAKDMLEELNESDFIDTTPYVDPFTEFKNSMKDADPYEVLRRLTRGGRSGQHKVWLEANKEIKSPEQQAEYERNSKAWQDLCAAKAKEMLENGQLDENDFTDITPYTQEEELVQPQPQPEPADTRQKNDLFEKEAKPFIDKHRPALKKARRRAIWQTALGVLSLAFGLDIAVSTFAVVPMAAALTGALIPVIALSGLGFVGIAFGAVNVAKAIRHSRLFRHLTNAYTQRNRRGVRLSRALVEKSILRARRHSDVLGYDRTNLSVLNQGTYVYTPITTRMKNGIVKQGVKVKKGAKRINKKRVLWARDRKENKSFSKEISGQIADEKERLNYRIKQAQRAKKTYAKEERRFDGDLHTVMTPQEANHEIINAKLDLRALKEVKKNVKEDLSAKKKEDKDARRIKTLSDEKKQRLLREFKASMTEEQRKEFNNKTAEERRAQVMAYLNQRVNKRRAGANPAATEANENTNVSAM